MERRIDMVTIDEAYRNVKKAYPNFKVLEGFEFKGKFAFDISGNNISYIVEVLKDDGQVVTADMDEMFNNLDELEEARKKAKTFERAS